MRTMAPSLLFLSHDNKIGDAIVLTGLFGPLKARWPDALIGVVCGQSNAVIYQTHPLIDHVHIARSRNLLARLGAGLSARQIGYGQLVHFGSDVDSRSLRALIRATGISESVVFFEPRKPLTKKQVVIRGDWMHVHTSARHRAYLQSHHLTSDSYRYDLHPDAAGEAAARAWLARDLTIPGPHLVIACDASTRDRSFGAHWVRELCEQLVAMIPQCRITLLCASAERHAEFEESQLGPAVHLAPLHPDAGLALALIARAQLLISPDTFAVHAASGFNIPVIAVYPGDTHTLMTWAPRSGRFVQLVARAGESIGSNSPELVAQHALALLGTAAKPENSP